MEKLLSIFVKFTKFSTKCYSFFAIDGIKKAFMSANALR